MQNSRENKVHIGFFGRCNVGKSSLINVLTNQQTAIVSSKKGTTTDIVKKTIELFDIGIVTLIDTAGLDDDSELGEKRKQKTSQAIDLVDMAVVVVSDNCFQSTEMELIESFNKKKIPYIIVYNKQDIFPIQDSVKQTIEQYFKDFICISINNNDCREQLTLLIKKHIPYNEQKNNNILDGIINENDIVLLVTPIDISAPKGRLILPQVKMIREILDNKAISIVVQKEQLKKMIEMLGTKIKLVITDSQVFDFVNNIVPKEIYLTSFSILLAKEKGAFEEYLKGVTYLRNLKDGDRVLMLENCTHQPTCEDIGRVKLPKRISKFTGKNLIFEALAGLTDGINQPSNYAMVIQCGGCVATEKQLLNRLQPFIQANIPITNYGIAIAFMNGIFERSCEIFNKVER